MKQTKRKMTAFMTTWVTLVIMGILNLIFSPATWSDFSKYFVIGLLVNAFVFISFTVLKDFIKSRWFNASLFKGEYMPSVDDMMKLNGEMSNGTNEENDLHIEGI